MNKLQKLLNQIAIEAWENHSDEEFRGLYVMNDREHSVHMSVMKTLDLTPKTIIIELGFNYPDSTNLSFVFQGWNKAFGFALTAVKPGASIRSTTQYAYFQEINTLLNERFEELQNAYNEEYNK